MEGGKIERLRRLDVKPASSVRGACYLRLCSSRFASASMGTPSQVAGRNRQPMTAPIRSRSSPAERCCTTIAPTAPSRVMTKCSWACVSFPRPTGARSEIACGGEKAAHERSPYSAGAKRPICLQTIRSSKLMLEVADMRVLGVGTASAVIVVTTRNAAVKSDLDGKLNPKTSA